MKRYQQAYNGEWIQPVRRGYLMRCCDCKLVHILDFRIIGGRIQFRAHRDERKTAASRRGSGPAPSPPGIKIGFW